MKIVYSISKICSFLFTLFIVSAVLTFIIPKPKGINYNYQTNVLIGEYRVDIKSANNQETYFMYIEQQKTPKYAISVAYYIFDHIEKSFLFVLQDITNIYQVSISQAGYASLVYVEK